MKNVLKEYTIQQALFNIQNISLDIKEVTKMVKFC